MSKVHFLLSFSLTVHCYWSYITIQYVISAISPFVNEEQVSVLSRSAFSICYLWRLFFKCIISIAICTDKEPSLYPETFFCQDWKLILWRWSDEVQWRQLKMMNKVFFDINLSKTASLNVRSGFHESLDCEGEIVHVWRNKPKKTFFRVSQFFI